MINIKEHIKNNTTFDLSNQNLKQFPTELYEYCDVVEYLDLSKNELSFLPNDLYQFKNLKYLFLNENQFSTFPESISQLNSIELIGLKSNKINFIAENAIPKHLKWLILTNNQLVKLPNSIGECTQLQKCMLAGNQLIELPTQMQNCKNLELLRISANQLPALPEWLFSLPKLTWLAFSGNKFNTLNTENSCSEFDSNLIEYKQLLGEGASGFIYKASSEIFDNKDVAVKIFKGEVTSDGYPHDEIEITLRVGKHPNLVELVGKLNNHKEGKKGLIFNLISEYFKNLASPPSLQSCTRDIFNKIDKISVQTCLSIIKQLVSVAKHLHSKGIIHGDFYAHNTLINIQNNEILFTDFGAASLYDLNGNFAENIEKIEVRALGIFIDDLLKVTKNDNAKTFLSIENLKNKCLNSNLNERPLFSQIDSFLIK